MHLGLWYFYFLGRELGLKTLSQYCSKASRAQFNKRAHTPSLRAHSVELARVFRWGSLLRFCQKHAQCSWRRGSCMGTTVCRSFHARYLQLQPSGEAWGTAWLPGWAVNGFGGAIPFCFLLSIAYGEGHVLTCSFSFPSILSVVVAMRYWRCVFVIFTHPNLWFFDYFSGK